MNRSPFPFVLF